MVADVLWATTGTGVSWKLSGGSQLCSSVTKVSKYSHVLRAAVRSSMRSLSLTWRRSSVSAERLMSQANAGEPPQKMAKMKAMKAPVESAITGSAMPIRPISSTPLIMR